MKFRFSLLQVALGAVALSTFPLGACGGRYQIRESEDGGSGGNGNAGSSPSAGRGGSVTSSAGASTGGSGIAGLSGGGAPSGAGANGGQPNDIPGFGGGTNCQFVTCSVHLDCLGGQERLTEPGQCCPSKCSACVPCPIILCPAGYHQERTASDCCPRCVEDANVNSCLQGQQVYAMQRQAMVDKYAFGCASSSGCVSVAPVNACEQGCGYAAIGYGLADSFESNLSNLAQSNCSSCALGPLPSCPPPKPPVCLNGRCVQ